MLEKKPTIRAAVFLFSFIAFAGAYSMASAANTTSTNLIQNASMQAATVSSSSPDDWNQGNWGTNTATFSYPATGTNGATAATVAISSYTSGDAKWYFNNVPVTAGAVYNFSDSYNSTAPSSLVVQFTSADNALSYEDIDDLASTGGAWGNVSAAFSVPAGVTALTIFHLIQSVGSLTTENYFLGTSAAPTSTPPAPTSTPPAAPAPLAINPITLPNGQVGTAYSETLTASTTATGTFSWSLSGTLPAGLALGTSTGLTDTIKGNPTVAGTSTFAIKATNGASSSTRSYTINIASVATSTPPAPTSTPPVATSTLTVNVGLSGGTSTVSAFNLTVKNGTSTLFTGAAASTKSFVLNRNTSYAVTEATTTASANYKIALGSNCSGTIGTSSVVCAITNTFVAPTSTAPTSTPPAPTSTSNLIVNPSLTKDTIASGTPDGWNQGGWGTNTATFNYPVTGTNGGVGANITISSYTSGDEKWYFNNVPVTAGSNYTFSDSYNSNVLSTLVVQFTNASGTTSFTQLATLPSTNGAWATTTQNITVPANETMLTVFHLISSVGSLTTTNYSLTLASGGTGSDLFPEGLVSLTFDDGWESQYDNALPILQAANMHGTFYIISDGMLNAIETIFPSSDNPFAVTTTTKATTWPDIYTDPTQHSFVFNDTYTATGPSILTASYTLSDGVTASSTVLGTFAAGKNVNTTSTFTLPILGGPVTITQSVTGTSTLTATNPLLTQPVGYMDTNHVLGLQAAGEEIGDHTVNHCDLVAIYNSPTSTASCAVLPPATTTVQFQIDEAKTQLQNVGLSPITTFAYPYGSGAGNSAVEGLVGADGLISARSVNAGYNTKATDPYALLTQSVDTTVPNFATVQQWIDYAATNKVWLILTFHQIELSSSTITQNDETDATTAAMLQQIVSYLATQRVAGKIDVDTVNNIMTQYVK